MRVLIGLVIAGTVVAGEPPRVVVDGPCGLPDVNLQELREEPFKELLADMTGAARNADVGKYMIYVSEADPLFVHEQRAWATNLRKKPPTEFSFELAEDPNLIIDVGYTQATANVILTWRPTPDPQSPNQIPEPISVTFPAKFVTLPIARANPDVPWLFAGVAWEEELTAPDGSRVLCMTADREKGERLLMILPAALASAAECFETDTPTATVKLYPTLELLNASISPGLTSPIAGWNDPGESIKLGAPAVGGDAEAILVHEAAHAVQFTLGPHPHDAPWWVLEGSAERAAELARANDDPARIIAGTVTDNIVRRWARRGRLADWDDLAVYDERMPAGVEKAYIQGHHMIAYLDETYSPAARNLWMRLLLNATPLDEASSEAFGVGFDEIDQSWRATLGDPVKAGESADDPGP